MFALTDEERAHPGVPDRGHAALVGRDQRPRWPPTSGGRTWPISRLRRCSPRRARRAPRPIAATHTFPQTYPGWQCLTSKVVTGTRTSRRARSARSSAGTTRRSTRRPGCPTPCTSSGRTCTASSRATRTASAAATARRTAARCSTPTTAGDPDGAATGAGSMRTFTDLSYDATINHPSWCAYRPYFDNGCVNSPNGIHPDQHVIVINPGNPTQIFEGSDGGMIRTSGAFADVSAQCDEPHRNGGGPLTADSGSYVACQRLLSRVPTTLDAHRQEAEQHAPVHQRRHQPVQRLRGHGRHAGQRHVVEPQTAATTRRGPRSSTATAATPATTRPTRRGGSTSSRAGSATRTSTTATRSSGSSPPPPSSRSGEGPAFYWPQIADPNPAPGTHPIYSGARHVWRTLGVRRRPRRAPCRRTRLPTSRATRRTARSS